MGFVDIITQPGCLIKSKGKQADSSSGTTEKKKIKQAQNKGPVPFCNFFVFFCFVSFCFSLFTADDEGRALGWVAAYCARIPEYISAPFLSEDPGQ